MSWPRSAPLLKLVCSTLFLLLFYATPLLAEEEILFFTSRIFVSENSTIAVQETIQVRVEGNQFKRGIFRDIPTRRKTAFGFNRGTDLVVTAVTRNGSPEHYTVSDISGDLLGDSGIRIKIGNASVFLDHGIHTYTIEYTSTNQIDYFEDFDELFWNVTGNGWNFKIQNAESYITLPDSVPAGEVTVSGYTGEGGSKEQAITVERRGGTFYVQTTRTLDPREGLTVLAQWPKGHVYEPSDSERMREFFRHNTSSVFAIVGLLLILLYYYLVWSSVGVDPDKGTIIPQYEAPDGLSPAEVRYLSRMGFDRKAFTAEIIDMAAKGFLEIEQAGGVYTLMKTGKEGVSLSSTQKKIADKLFSTSDSISLRQTNHRKFQSAISALHTALKKAHLKKHFETNRSYFFSGMGFSLIVIFVSAYLHAAEALGVAVFMSVWLTGWTFGVIAITTQVVSLWRRVFAGEPLMIVGAVFLSIFAFPFIAGECFGLFMLVGATTPVIGAVLVALGVLGYLFYHLLKAPTFRGRKIMDRIDGLKLYLGVAEKERLHAMHPPQKTPEEFEKFLPYALALDVEQEWSEKFSDVLESASSGAERSAGGYNPSFYRGNSFNNIGAFSSSFSSSFSSALSSASSSPRSSGGGGGGSSGGGGGGGGGGGW